MTGCSLDENPRNELRPLFFPCLAAIALRSLFNQNITEFDLSVRAFITPWNFLCRFHDFNRLPTEIVPSDGWHMIYLLDGSLSSLRVRSAGRNFRFIRLVHRSWGRRSWG